MSWFHEIVIPGIYYNKLRQIEEKRKESNLQC